MKLQKIESIKKNSIFVREKIIQNHNRLGGNIKFGRSSRFN